MSETLGQFANVDLRLAPAREHYTAPDLEGQFDLIMIDGLWRDECVPLAIRHLADGGVIYLDNCDKLDLGVGDMGKARRDLITFAEQHGLPWCEFTDFAPTQFFVERGLWVGPLPR